MSDTYHLMGVSHTHTSSFQDNIRSYSLRIFYKPGAYFFRIFCKFIDYPDANIRSGLVLHRCKASPSKCCALRKVTR